MISIKRAVVAFALASSLIAVAPAHAAPKYKTQHLNELWLTPIKVSLTTKLSYPTNAVFTSPLPPGEHYLVVQFYAVNKNDVPQVVAFENLTVEIPGQIIMLVPDTYVKDNIISAFFKPGQALVRNAYFILPVHSGQTLLVWSLEVPINYADRTNPTNGKATRFWTLNV